MLLCCLSSHWGRGSALSKDIVQAQVTELTVIAQQSLIRLIFLLLLSSFLAR